MTLQAYEQVVSEVGCGREKGKSELATISQEFEFWTENMDAKFRMVQMQFDNAVIIYRVSQHGKKYHMMFRSFITSFTLACKQSIYLCFDLALSRLSCHSTTSPFYHSATPPPLHCVAWDQAP